MTQYTKNPYRNVKITDHACQRIRERLGIEPTETLVGEVWARQMGPDPAWKVPLIRLHGKKLRYLSRENYVFVFEVVDRSAEHRKALAKLITVVGPLSEDSPWKSSYDEEGY